MKPFWEHSAEVARRLADGPLLVTLDFDGTLAALAETPDKARLRPEYLAALRALAARRGVKVFILSGRSLADIRRLVPLPGVYHGGNHGMELKGPGFHWRDGAAARAMGRVAAVAAEIAARFPAGTGALVENKGFSASVHYRALKPAFRAGFMRHMAALRADPPAGLAWGRGHKVFELKPARAPHKGDAALRLARRVKARALFAAGDDLTDEDMFRALAGRGVTLRVGCRRRTAAEYCLKGQGEMIKVLHFLAGAGREGGRKA